MVSTLVPSFKEFSNPLYQTLMAPTITVKHV